MHRRLIGFELRTGVAGWECDFPPGGSGLYERTDLLAATSGRVNNTIGPPPYDVGYGTGMARIRPANGISKQGRFCFLVSTFLADTRLARQLQN